LGWQCSLVLALVLRRSRHYTRKLKYAKEYAPNAQAIIKAAGGRFVAIGGAGGNAAGKVTGFDGEPPRRVTVQVWDSLEKIQAWRADPAQIAHRKIGDKYATFRGYAVDGVPQ
jgi:uncharacterized protein (DUF1330 family)